MSDILYFDCFSGISGDMVLGALLDLGVDRDLVFAELETLALSGYRLQVTQRQVHGLRSTDFAVLIDQPPASHRHLADIVDLIEGSGISSFAKALAIDIFHALGRAEAKVHGIGLEKVHFHEVGAIDSIIDIVGAAICIDSLKPKRVVASPLHVGCGTVRCAHGVLPVPAPATAELVKGVPIYGGEVQGELVTPTGAAIITVLAEDFGKMPAMTVERIGYGAGKKEFGIPNLLRVFQGRSGQKAGDEMQEEMLLLETNIDDMNPELYSYLLPLLLDKGANDAYLSSIIMKKGRPGVMLNVLCRPEDSSTFEEIIFSETSTLGIRRVPVTRNCLGRRIESIATPLGSVLVKIALKDGKVVKAAPEYEECVRLARPHDLPAKEVYDRITGCAAMQELLSRI